MRGKHSVAKLKRFGSRSTLSKALARFERLLNRDQSTKPEWSAAHVGIGEPLAGDLFRTARQYM